MDSIAVTLVVIFAGVVLIPPLARRIKVPVIVAEILFGIIIGKSLFDIVPENSTVDFFSSFGLTYLMFLAGLETDFGRMTGRNLKKILVIVLVSIAIPFVSGALLSIWVDVHPMLMGTMFCTTSLGLLLPVLKDLPLPRRHARLLLLSVVLVDIVSLFILAIVLTSIEGFVAVRFVYSIIIIIVLFLVPWFIRRRRMRRKISRILRKERYFDIEIRLAFALIFLLAAISDQLGFHSIIGAFIAGLIISEAFPKAVLQEQRLQSFGYGFFIPLFFILTGARVNLPAVFSDIHDIEILIAIVGVGLLSKASSVTIASKLIGLNLRQSAAFGLFHTARLSLIIAAADISIRLGLISESMFAMFVILAIVSATVAPSAGRYILATQKN